MRDSRAPCRQELQASPDSKSQICTNGEQNTTGNRELDQNYHRQATREVREIERGEEVRDLTARVDRDEIAAETSAGEGGEERGLERGRGRGFMAARGSGEGRGSSGAF